MIQQQPEAPKRSEAVFVADRMQAHATGWHRIVTFFFEGDDYQYVLEAVKAGTEDDARQALYGPTVDKDLRGVFLQSVRLDMTRPH